jgi:site-specific DNA recombinase
MLKVTKIPSNKETTAGHTRLRVAAYCRVSTDHDDQIGSLEAQTNHYIYYIGANPKWECAGIYVDDGISGTKKDKRAGLQRMLSDCEGSKIDFIVTKSISRFARNMVDCLETVRRLTELGIHIFFEKENINTGTMDGELMLTILSSLAENESISFSKNNKWSVQRSFQNGTYRQSSPPYGYVLADGALIVKPDQAEVVRRIFREARGGRGSEAIARGLNADGIPASRGSQWHSSAVLWILRNERYTGDERIQKTYTDDHFVRHINHGERDQYLIQNHHEPIISREEFEAVAEALLLRGKGKGVVKDTRKYLNRYPFSGKIQCGECGGMFKRRIHSYAGRAYIAWCCSNHLSHGAHCSMLFLREDAIERAFVALMNKLISGDGESLDVLRQCMKNVAGEGLEALQRLEAMRKENAERGRVLMNLASKGCLDPALFKMQSNELHLDAEKLKEKMAALARTVDGGLTAQAHAKQLVKYVIKEQALLEAYDGCLFERFVESITVFSPTVIGFRMKCGILFHENVERR